MAGVAHRDGAARRRSSRSARRSSSSPTTCARRIRVAALSEGARALPVQPRLDRRRPGRPDPPAGRPALLAAGDPRARRHAARRRERVRRGLRRVPRRPTGRPRSILSRQDAPGPRRDDRARPSAPRSTAPTCSPSPTTPWRRSSARAARCTSASTRRRRSPRRASPCASSRCRAGSGSTAARSSTRRRCSARTCPAVSVEAGATLGWERYADESIGIDTFGTSAPGDVALEFFGFTRGRGRVDGARRCSANDDAHASSTTTAGRAPGSTTSAATGCATARWRRSSTRASAG